MKTTTIELSGQAYDELEQVLILAGEAATINGHITLNRAEISRRNLPNVSEIDIIDHVCFAWRQHGITRADVFSKNRNAKIVDVRQMAMTLMRQVKDMSSNEVGIVFNRDHGTVLHAETQVRNRRETDPKYAAVYNELLAKLGVK